MAEKSSPKETQAETKKGMKKRARNIEKHMDAVCKLPFVSELDDGECGRLAGIATVITLKKGQILIQQGKKDDSLYILIKGRLQVNRGTGGGEHVTLACIREGEMAGEMGFLDGSEHSATLQADCTTDVLQIKRKHLESLLDEHPQIVYKLMRAIAREVHEITKRMNMQYVEMSNYIHHQHGRY
ncbi:MAG: cyclic nucleotide-binding domain-containing protein [Chromatiales bacterium]|uniref:Crp/Fnr family transcriptional regulator n=1 Tax=endosymbiont of Lamellibrachia barhami TaxID=205975 RepID=UPI0015B25530|nr:cyclic nucleotide-binding domain-containing protein [endosymbiont of Lamellibrachia barhami]MBA1444404.1 cyclic nucleotide-binding domain-containing protein [Gammaproteobacteria bacterium]